MKEISKDVAIVSLIHRDWSCEAIYYRVKTIPMPGSPAGGNHLFVIIEDKCELMDNEKSRESFSRIILSRYPGIPAKRLHLIFFVSCVEKPNGMTVKMYNFDRNDNRQSVIKPDPVDFSENTAVCAMVMF
ncbi:hypothetical protein ACLI07_23675 (plasmid) [Providencia huaxiensis]|uniref:Uncharacterized protein n=3 Tax=Providencia TaxID=586 RepID=A0AA42FNE3_9GAMM|nr:MULTISPECIES: hypothetical protein [Enterobacterales]ELB1214762.1 hypothetical protein [Proteus mirabilis]HAU5618409.1 hypothetical protein [Morganella morganii]HAZ7869410.1 hypothetical protein [Escherichia coli]ELR5094204.1 hypothetical protein [Providencia rettgeri]ELR5243238.1 hypothetical protein [Providencia rettgeri]